MKPSKLILLAFFFICTSSTLAQDDAVLGYFTAVQNDDHIQISLAILRGSSCQGIGLERSSDALNFEPIDFIPGVCGGSEFTEVYSFTDKSPLEYSDNHYRLKLGSKGLSHSISIRFVRLEDGYRIYPTPAQNWAVIKYDNPTALEYYFTVYSINGQLLESEPSITTNEIYMDLGHYSSGTYIFQLSNPSVPTITGRLIVSQ
ncbi:MAG: hypothetical protein ACI84C_002668 [Flavobacteriales bacterium]|jgi:hypothetical protein